MSKKVVCRICKDGISAKTANLHLSAHYKDIVYICLQEKCYLEFPSHDSFEMHAKVKHEGRNNVFIDFGKKKVNKLNVDGCEEMKTFQKVPLQNKQERKVLFSKLVFQPINRASANKSIASCNKKCKIVRGSKANVSHLWKPIEGAVKNIRRKETLTLPKNDEISASLMERINRTIEDVVVKNTSKTKYQVFSIADGVKTRTRNQQKHKVTSLKRTTIHAGVDEKISTKVSADQKKVACGICRTKIRKNKCIMKRHVLSHLRREKQVWFYQCSHCKSKKMQSVYLDSVTVRHLRNGHGIQNAKANVDYVDNSEQYVTLVNRYMEDCFFKTKL